MVCNGFLQSWKSNFLLKKGKYLELATHRYLETFKTDFRNSDIFVMNAKNINMPFNEHYGWTLKISVFLTLEPKTSNFFFEDSHVVAWNVEKDEKSLMFVLKTQKYPKLLNLTIAIRQMMFCFFLKMWHSQFFYQPWNLLNPPQVQPSISIQTPTSSSSSFGFMVGELWENIKSPRK